jgi:hypothetical protein
MNFNTLSKRRFLMGHEHEPLIVITTPVRDLTKAYMVTGAGVIEIDFVNKTIKLKYPEMGGGWGPGPIKRLGQAVELYQTFGSETRFDGVKAELGNTIISEIHAFLKQTNALATQK